MLVHHQTRMKWAVVVVGLTIEENIHVGGVVASVGASWRPHHHHQGGGAQHPRRRRRARTRHDILIHGKLVVMRIFDWSYLPEIAERAIREGVVTKGSTTAQSLFNYERTGYTGPNRSRRDLPPMFLRVDGRGSAKDILRSGCTTTLAMGAVRRRMRTQTATPASFHLRLVRLIQVKLSK